MNNPRGYCECGRRTSHKNNDKWLCLECEMGLEEKLTNKDKNILDIVKRSDVTLQELKFITNNLKDNKIHVHKDILIDKKIVKYGVISDTHIGSIYYDEKLMSQAAFEFNKRNVDFVIHGGDLCEGHYELLRQGSIFELNCIGGDNQLNKAVNELKKINSNIPIYLITGNHEYNTFYRNSGFDIGEQLELRLKNVKYLGNAEGIINLPFKNKIQIMHPDGGSSYAISYRSQKIADSLEGGFKPNILHIGHYHKSEYIFYRNIHIIQNGCLQKQTKFMKGKHLSAHRGFWVITAEVTKKGITKIIPEFFPMYK